MPTRDHEIWLELITERPTFAADLLECVCPGVLSDYEDVRLESGELSEHRPTEYHADAVVSFHRGERTWTVCWRCCQRRPKILWS
jgi:hypothetical protein